MGDGDWLLTVTGDVIRIDRENVDKSGRNPKFNYTFMVRATEVEAPAGVNLPSPELPVRISGRELAKLIDPPPSEGDRVTITARGNGPNPRLVTMTAVRKLARS